MKGLKLIEVYTYPALAWKETKETANRLAEAVCTMFKRKRDAVEVSCGQQVNAVTIREGDIDLHVREDHLYLAGPYRVLPRDASVHWDMTLSEVRQFCQILEQVTEEVMDCAIASVLDQ
jgi:hypothetical protein